MIKTRVKPNEVIQISKDTYLINNEEKSIEIVLVNESEIEQINQPVTKRLIYKGKANGKEDNE